MVFEGVSKNVCSKSHWSMKQFFGYTINRKQFSECKFDRKVLTKIPPTNASFCTVSHVPEELFFHQLKVGTWLFFEGKTTLELPYHVGEGNAAGTLVTWVTARTWLFFKGTTTAEPLHFAKEGSAAGIPGDVGYGREMVIL